MTNGSEPLRGLVKSFGDHQEEKKSAHSKFDIHERRYRIDRKGAASIGCDLLTAHRGFIDPKVYFVYELSYVVMLQQSSEAREKGDASRASPFSGKPADVFWRLSMDGESTLWLTSMPDSSISSRRL